MLMNKCLLVCVVAFFVRPFYKVLLNKKIVLQDIEACDVEFYNSTKYILENDPEPLCLNFSVTREWLGQVSSLFIFVQLLSSLSVNILLFSGY